MSYAQRYTMYVLLIAAGLLLVPILSYESLYPNIPSTGTQTANVSSPFIYSFNSPGTLYEAGSETETTSPYWWVNSGARLQISGGMGMTNQGELPLRDRFRLLYAASNPLDTDFGKYPQNTFRLVSRNDWENVRVSAQFRIIKDNLTNTPNRNASNGLLFMSRYADSQSLYYAGIRVDGAAVIKKKYQGSYYTMAYKKIFDGTYSAASPNLLPHDEWIGLRSETVTNSDGSVAVRLYMQREGGAWTLLLEAVDDGKKYAGTPPIAGSHAVGIRTDFMDVQFKNYRSETITQ